MPRLTDDDPALLLVPLAAARSHLARSHPAIAERLAVVETRIDPVERR